MSLEFKVMLSYAWAPQWNDRMKPCPATVIKKLDIDLRFDLIYPGDTLLRAYKGTKLLGVSVAHLNPEDKYEAWAGYRTAARLLFKDVAFATSIFSYLRNKHNGGYMLCDKKSVGTTWAAPSAYEYMQKFMWSATRIKLAEVKYEIDHMFDVPTPEEVGELAEA
jgi:hypothetical protein